MRVIDELKTHIDLVEIANRYTGLVNAGKHRMKGLCPLHKETNPSFYIYSDSQRWHCFGCNKGGDVLDLVQEMEGWDFPTTLQELALYSGYPLEPVDAKTHARWEQKRQNESILTVAVAYFEKLMAGRESPGMQYACSRDWQPETIQLARLGYYDGNLPALRAALQAAEIDLTAPVARAVMRTPGPSLVYPFLHNKAVTYYAVRIINPAPGKSKAWNPPSDLVGSKPLYYNAHYTPRTETVVIVEGQGDAVTLGQWNKPAIATVGTHVSDEFANKLTHHKNIYIGMEQNEAGIKYASTLASSLDPNVKLVHWPQDDANAWLQDGATAEDLDLLIAKAPTWLDWLVDDAAHNPPVTDVTLLQIFQALGQMDTFQRARKGEVIRKKLNLSIRAYNKMLRAAQDESGLLDELAHAYCIDAGRICRKVADTNGTVILSPLCNFNARIVRDVVLDDGILQKRHFMLSGAMMDGTQLPDIRIPADNFDRMHWALESWGAQTIINVGFQTRNHLRSAIQQLSNGVTPEHEYGHLGWREIEGRPVYLTKGGAVGSDNVHMHLPIDLYAYYLPSNPGEGEKLRIAASASLRFWDTGDFSVTVPLWSLMYLAPLSSLIHPCFTLWIYGTTGCMKSTLTALAMCHYGHFSYDAPTTSWNSTTFALRRLSFLAKDAPLWIDDYTFQSTPTGQRNLQTKADELLREWGNRTMRSAGRQDGRLRDSLFPRGVVVTTAEVLPQDVSIRARLFTVEVRPGMITGGAGSKLTRAQNVDTALYPAAMTGYIQWLTAQWQDLKSILKVKLAEYQSKAQLRLTHHPRSASNTAMLGAALELGLRYHLNAGSLTQTDFEGRLDAGWEVLLGLSEFQDKHINLEHDSVTMYFDALSIIFTQGTGYLRSLQHPHAKSKTYPLLRTAHSVLLGWYDKENWYLLSNAVYKSVYQFYRESGILFPDSDRGVKTKLLERGMIVYTNVSRYEYQIRIQEQRKRVLVVPAGGKC